MSFCEFGQCLFANFIRYRSVSFVEGRIRGVRTQDFVSDTHVGHDGRSEKNRVIFLFLVGGEEGGTEN